MDQPKEECVLLCVGVVVVILGLLFGGPNLWPHLVYALKTAWLYSKEPLQWLLIVVAVVFSFSANSKTKALLKAEEARAQENLLQRIHSVGVDVISLSRKLDVQKWEVSRTIDGVRKFQEHHEEGISKLKDRVLGRKNPDVDAALSELTGGDR